MEPVELNQVISQLKAMASAANAGVPRLASEGETSGNFATLLQGSIDQVNALQQQAGRMAKAFEGGDANTSLSEVMVSLQKASLAFQTMAQVRNKLVRAYQDIMSMPI